METGKEKLIDKLIWLVFLTLTVLTPIIFTNINTELYEVPKMSLVYFCACLLFTLTCIKFIREKKITIPKTPILSLLLVFIAIQIVSTITSIDKFTSIYGYPTRLNGGLVSQIAYLIIFTAALINLNQIKAIRLLTISIVTAFSVALIGILSHFNFDLTCHALTGNISSACWEAEFNPQLRIFSTLGQPNWLATYLVLIIPFSLSLLIRSSKGKGQIFFSLISLSLLLALIFTGSRSGFAGLIASLLIYFTLTGKQLLKKNRKLFIAIMAISILLIVTSGSTLLSRLGESIKRQKTVEGGTETGQIRLIVWQGAIEAFKKATILGNGPETFAYAYSANRPEAHNQTTEWNFFYNKAHNEFLNYLANIGLSGTVFYLAFIFATLLQLFKITKDKNLLNSSLLKAAISALIGYHVAIFFGFSTVVSQLVMFLTIALMLSLVKTKTTDMDLKFNKITQKITYAVFILLGFWALTATVRIYSADVFFNRSKNLDGNDSIKAAFNAIDTYPTQNPFYLSDFAQSSATYASNFEDEEAKKDFFQLAVTFADKSLNLSPNNFIIIRRLINTYILLNDADNKYEKELSNLKQKLQTLAPTDPQTYLTSAKIEVSLSNTQKAKEHLEYALKLKPDYIEAQQLLEEINSTIDKQQSTINN